VIKVSGARALQPATFADSSKLQVGEIVLAMGNPLDLASSVAEGIVSAVGRTVTEPRGSSWPGATLPDTIQTSAAIDPGNSGGALVDLAGDVVGIPTLAAIDPQTGGGAAPGIGFAISSNIVRDIAGQLVKNRKVLHSHRAVSTSRRQRSPTRTASPPGPASIPLRLAAPPRRPRSRPASSSSASKEPPSPPFRH
jgi:S1-C subfamily serine protease